MTPKPASRKPRFKVGQVVYYSMVLWNGETEAGYGVIERLFGKGPHAANVCGCRYRTDTELRPLTKRERGE